ncbi:MAG: glycerophosphodiester phosphodiesterase family protein [Ignavibacteriaceae bacterium]
MEIKKLHNITHESSTLYIAHRGESLFAPENTMEAVNLAWQKNADGIEIDVHLSRDNEIIVIHDKNTKRTTGLSHLIRNKNLEEIKKFHIKNTCNKSNLVIRIPTLNEVLDTVPKHKLVFIEIKCGIEILPMLKKILKETRRDNSQIKIICFNLGIISTIKKYLPQFEVLWIKRIGIEKSMLYLDGLSKIISKIKQNNIDGLNLSYSRFLSKNIVENVKSNKIKLFIWTVNDTQKALRLMSFGVDGIVSDKASWLKNHLDEYSKLELGINNKRRNIYSNSF